MSNAERKATLRRWGGTHCIITRSASPLPLMGPIRVSANIDFTRAWRSRNIVSGCVCGLIRTTRRCGGIARASLLSFQGSLVAPSYRATLRGDSIAHNAEPKCVVRPVEMATRIDCDFMGCGNIMGGFPRRLTCANFRCSFVARSA
jgi:hypothetical protein